MLKARALYGVFAAAAVAFHTAPAVAGAWTLPAGDTQIITGAIFSTATESFDDSGGAVPTYYKKLLLQSYGEHGLLDDLTLVLAPEYAIATEAAPNGKLIHASDFALTGGLRYRLTDAFGIVSVQASYKTAGAFDMSVSANQDSGSEMELRLLYGANFTLFHRDAYFDAEIAERWIAGARPNETPIDLTLGLHWSEKLTFMAQSFNIIAGGHGEAPTATTVRTRSNSPRCSGCGRASIWKAAPTSRRSGRTRWSSAASMRRCGCISEHPPANSPHRSERNPSSRIPYLRGPPGTI